MPQEEGRQRQQAQDLLRQLLCKPRHHPAQRPPLPAREQADPEAPDKPPQRPDPSPHEEERQRQHPQHQRPDGQVQPEEGRGVGGEASQQQQRVQGVQQDPEDPVVGDANGVDAVPARRAVGKPGEKGRGAGREGSGEGQGLEAGASRRRLPPLLHQADRRDPA